MPKKTQYNFKQETGFRSPQRMINYLMNNSFVDNQVCSRLSFAMSEKKVQAMDHDEIAIAVQAGLEVRGGFVVR